MNPRHALTQSIRLGALVGASIGAASCLSGCGLWPQHENQTGLETTDRPAASTSQLAADDDAASRPGERTPAGSDRGRESPGDATVRGPRAHQSLAGRMGVGTYATLSNGGQREAGAGEPGINPERFGERPKPSITPAGREGIESPNVSQITFAFEGAAFDPSVSSDGKTLVFASTQHRPTSDIYIKNTRSRVITQLTTSEAHDAMPALSPDGSRIAFASNRSGNWDIYVMPASGGRALQITSDPSHEIHPAWSPDGSELVFNRLGRTTGRWEMWITEANDASTSHLIGYGLFPEWSPAEGLGPNGSDLIAFQRPRQRGDRAYSVWTMSYREGFAGNMTEIAAAPDAALINPTWSPDGKRLAFAAIPNDGSWGALSADTPENAHLYMVDLNGTNLVKLTEGASADLMPAWASNSHLFFASDRGGEENLWSLDIADAVRLAEGKNDENAPTFANAPEDQ